MKFFLPEEKDQSRVPDPPKPDKGDHPTAVPIVGQNGSSSASSPVSPTAIPPVAAAQNRVIQKVRVIRHTGDPGLRSYLGPAMVEGSPSYRKWKRDNPTPIQI